MKMYYTLLCLFFILVIKNSIAQVNLQSGLIAYYPLDNSSLDSTSNHLDLTAFGSPVGALDRFNVLPGAYSFNAGNPDFFTAAINPLLAPTEVTVSAWVKLTDATVDQKIVGRAEVNAGGYLLGVDSNKIDAEIWDLSGMHYRLKAKNVPSNIWTHLVMSYKATEYLRVYIDGLLTDSLPAGSVGVGTSSIWTLTIGGAPWQTAALNPTGSIDDVCIYNRAINNAEVVALYNNLTNNINGTETYRLNSIYPVPLCNGILSIDFNDRNSGSVEVVISDALGKNVFSARAINPGKELYDLSFLKNGLYSVSIINGNKIESHRLIIGN